MDAAIARLLHIADRTESRAQKIRAAHNVDISGVLTLLKEARSELDAAKRKMDSLGRETRQAITSEQPRQAFSTIKVAIKNAGTHIRSAHRLLSEAVEELETRVREAQAETGRTTETPVSE